jgi:type I restriction-modification system DNA methylase subunit
MNREQANTLVRQTFTQAFDKVRFQNFTLNLLNHIDESKASSWNNQYVKDAFKSHVQRYERLGTYTSPEKDKLDVLIVHLTHESKLERARTAIRNFVADHLKTRDEKDAALVAFVSPSETMWRFSYVKMEYATVEKDSGRVGVETRLTPARRFSYIVGEGESCHTAQTRFLGLLQDTETDPTLAEIEEAFSVEAVTKEFFTKYAELFEEIHKALDRLVAKDKTIHDEFTAKGVNTVDFAKKLMGQIVFLYFLQKKGWLGVGKGRDWGSGPRDFLRRLADGEYGKYNNFFNDILEPLFYDTLATDRGHAAWCNRFNCRMPFLNGGLFEPLGNYDWRKTDIILPNKLFTNSEFVEEGITGSGVLDVFDRYNFTVNEAEPLEKEVAIDPEMLGKVFENLIEENRRKGLGAYYTPREIVHYMCQESLINYLDTAINQTSEVSKTSEVSNTIPRADLETFVHLGEQISHYESVDTRYPIKMPTSIEQHARLIDEKLAEITICDPAVGSGAFPVGMMTEIVRARSALTPYFNDIHERTPYHFKRHAIQNCLYGVDIDPGAVEIAKLRLWLSLVVDEEDVKQIKPLPNLDYKIVAGNSLYGFPFRSHGLAVIEEIKKRYFDESDRQRKAALKSEIDEQIQKRLDGSVKSLGYRVLFDFQLYFSEVFHRKSGFDIVIGNPPYLNVELVSRIDKDYFASTYRTFYKRSDVFGLFFELGLTRLVQNGTVAFIVPQQVFNNLSYQKLRHLMLSNQWLDQVLYLGDKIFESVNNDVCVLFLRKPGVERIRLVNALDFDNRTISEVPTDYFDKFNGVISFSDDSSSPDLFNKIFDPKHERIKDRFDVFQGIVTGNNNVFILTLEQARDARIEKSLLHPILLGRDFEKWLIRSSERQIIYVDGTIDIQKYPNTLRYLRQYKDALSNSRSAVEKSTDWYCLHRPRVKSELDLTPKILVQGTRNPRLKTRIVATMDEICVYGTQGLNFIIPKQKSAPIYYALAVLNSTLINHLYATKFLNVAIKAEYLKDTPIPKASTAQEKELTNLAQKILAAKQRDPKADTSALEREIDQLVYQLYDLTPEEIAIVEESTRAK